MKSYLSILLMGLLFCVSGPASSHSDDLVPEISPYQSHMQVVNQALDQMETSGHPRDILAEAHRRWVMGQYHVLPPKNEFELSDEIYWARFEEPKNSAQRGFMAGYNAQFSHRISSASNMVINMVRLQGQWASGKFKSWPADQGFSGIKDSVYEVRGMLGRDLYFSQNFRATPYAGFGYRNLEDNSEGLMATVGGNTLVGFKKFAGYYYVPLGTDFFYQNNPYVSLQSNLEYDYVAHGRQEDKLGGFAGIDNLVFEQGDGFAGYGLRGSVRLNMYFKYFTAFVEGFYRYWNIVKSKNTVDPADATIVLNEPKNDTEEFGLRLGVKI